MSFEIGGDPSAIIGSGAGESGCLISRTVSATVRISGSASPRPCAAEM